MDSQESSPLQQSPQPHGHEETMAPPPPTFTPPPQFPQQPPPYSYETIAPPQLLQQLPLQHSHLGVAPLPTSTPPPQLLQLPHSHLETVAPLPTSTPPPQLLQQLPLPHSHSETMVPPPTSTSQPQLPHSHSTMPPSPTSTPPTLLLQHPLPPPPQPHGTMAPPPTPNPASQPLHHQPPKPLLPTPLSHQPHQLKQPDDDMVPAKITFHHPQSHIPHFLFNSPSGQQQKLNLGNAEGSATATAQKKRGRPKKSAAAAAAAAVPTQKLFKRPRGRPVGSGKKRKEEALGSGAAPLGNLPGLGLFPTPVVNQADHGATVPSRNTSGLGLYSTPVVNQADSVAAVPSEKPSALGFSFTPVMNQVDCGAAAPSGYCLGLPPTPVVSQANSGAAPSENPSGLGLFPTLVVNQADFGGAAPSENPAKKARGRPPGSGKKQHPEALDSGANASEKPVKKARGRPPASVKKNQPEALGAVGLPMQHMIPVDIGEDIITKLIPFSQQGPVAVCVLSATGDLSKATIREAAIGGGTMTLEGRFAIATLSGSYCMYGSCITGGLCVTLFWEDGSRVGGVVAGPLTAATPVQVVLSSFIPNTKKPESVVPPSAPPANC